MSNTLANTIFISTRPVNRDAHLRELLEAEGALLVSFPMLEIKCTPFSSELKNKLNESIKAQWLVFTSANGVNCYIELLREASIDLQKLQPAKLAVIGEKTANSLRYIGLEPIFISKRTTEGAVGFVEELLDKIHESSSICLIQGNLANEILEIKLSKRHKVLPLEVYKTMPPVKFDPAIVQQIKEGNYNEILFTSPSGIKHLLNLFPEGEEPALKAVCIGQTTARFAESVGIKPSAIAKKQSSEGILKSLKELYSTK